MAYIQGLQYWVERFNPPADLGFCPLVRSILELKERVKEHVIFSKQDIIQGLGRIDPGTTSWWSQPNITGIGSKESNSAGVWETHGTTSSLFGSPHERGDTTVLSTKLQMEDQPTAQDASPIEAATQTASATATVVKLTSPITPPDWTEEEKWYILVVTTLVRSLNLETTGVILGDMVTTSAGGGAFQSPCMAAVLPGPIQEIRAISNPGAMVKELGKKDAE